jgi:hypothetical protein
LPSPIRALFSRPVTPMNLKMRDTARLQARMTLSRDNTIAIKSNSSKNKPVFNSGDVGRAG